MELLLSNNLRKYATICIMVRRGKGSVHIQNDVYIYVTVKVLHCTYVLWILLLSSCFLVCCYYVVRQHSFLHNFKLVILGQLADCLTPPHEA
jgi:hypothetical protein